MENPRLTIDSERFRQDKNFDLFTTTIWFLFSQVDQPYCTVATLLDGNMELDNCLYVHRPTMHRSLLHGQSEMPSPEEMFLILTIPAVCTKVLVTTSFTL